MLTSFARQSGDAFWAVARAAAGLAVVHALAAVQTEVASVSAHHGRAHAGDVIDLVSDRVVDGVVTLAGKL